MEEKGKDGGKGGNKGKGKKGMKGQEKGFGKRDGARETGKDGTMVLEQQEKVQGTRGYASSVVRWDTKRTNARPTGSLKWTRMEIRRGRSTAYG